MIRDKEQSFVDDVMMECSGECDYCKWKKIISGTDERIDREPQYYCGLFQKEV